MIGASYPTKKALKLAVVQCAVCYERAAAHVQHTNHPFTAQGLRYEETSLFGPEYKANGTFVVVGPSPYKRNWFAEVTMRGGLIVKVR